MSRRECNLLECQCCEIIVSLHLSQTEHRCSLNYLRRVAQDSHLYKPIWASPSPQASHGAAKTSPTQRKTQRALRSATSESMLVQYVAARCNPTRINGSGVGGKQPNLKDAL